MKQFLNPHLPHRGLSSISMSQGSRLRRKTSDAKGSNKNVSSILNIISRKNRKNMKRTGLQLRFDGFCCYILWIPHFWRGFLAHSETSSGCHCSVQVKGVVHAAGTLADGLIKDMNRDNLQLVCSAKVIALVFFGGGRGEGRK